MTNASNNVANVWRTLAGEARLLRPLAAPLAATVLLAFLYRAILLPSAPGGDFVNHRIWGQRLLDGSLLYEGGLNVPYPPFWAVAHAPFALLPVPLAFVIYKAIGLAALVLLLVLAVKGREHSALPVFLVLVVARPFILRDLQDGGPNLIVLALAWSGVSLWSRGRGRAGAACLGAAIALKCTPAVFLLYFAAKRQWRMLAQTAGIALFLSLTPIAWQGPEAYLRHAKIWLGNVHAGLQAEPGSGVIGAEEMRNCSLRAALGRQLVALPPGHPGRLVHPWRIQLVHLSPTTAGYVVRGVLLLVLGSVLLRLGRFRSTCTDEWAAMALLMPLFSPIAWNQHCVAAIPALVLLFGRALAGECKRLCIVLTLLSAFYVVGLNRTTTSTMTAGLIASYGLVSWSLLMLLVASLNSAREAPGLPSARD